MIPDTMKMYPMLEGHSWYHCNLMGQKRDIARRSSVFIFAGVKCKSETSKEKSYSVMSCITLGMNILLLKYFLLNLFMLVCRRWDGRAAMTANYVLPL